MNWVNSKPTTAWKVSAFGLILVRIFQHSDLIRRDAPYLSVFSPNAGKCGPEYISIRVLFKQWPAIKTWPSTLLKIRFHYKCFHITFTKVFKTADSRTCSLKWITFLKFGFFIKNATKQILVKGGHVSYMNLSILVLLLFFQLQLHIKICKVVHWQNTSKFYIKLHYAFLFDVWFIYFQKAVFVYVMHNARYTLYSCLNIKKLVPRSKREIWSFSDSSWTRTHNRLVHKRTLNHLAKLANWLSCVVSTYLYGAFVIRLTPNGNNSLQYFYMLFCFFVVILWQLRQKIIKDTSHQLIF